jgi:hypothetical protein
VLREEILNELSLFHLSFFALRKLIFELFDVLERLFGSSINSRGRLIDELAGYSLCFLVHSSRKQNILRIQVDLLEMLIDDQVNIILTALVE